MHHVTHRPVDQLHAAPGLIVRDVPLDPAARDLAMQHVGRGVPKLLLDVFAICSPLNPRVEGSGQLPLQQMRD